MAAFPNEGTIQRNRVTGEMRISTGKAWVPYRAESAGPDKVSAGEALLVSAGRELATWGARAGLMKAPDPALYQQLEGEHPVATAVGSMMPSLATAPLGGGVVTQAAIGAATGYLGGGAQGAIEGAALSGLGAGAGKLIGRTVNAFRGLPAAAGYTDEGLRLLERGRELGFKAMPHRMASRLHNAARLNQVAANAMGVNADELSPGVFRLAKRRFDGAYNAFASQVKGSVVVGLSRDDLARVGVNAKFLNTVFDAKNTATTKPLSGEAAFELRRRLFEAVRAAAKTGGGNVMDEAKSYGAVVEDIIERQLPADTLGEFRIINEQYRNYLALNKGRTVVDSLGNVRPGGLVTSLQNIWGNTFKHGRETGLMETAGLFDAARLMNSPEFAASASATAANIAGGAATGAAIGAGQSYMRSDNKGNYARNMLLYGALGAAAPRVFSELSAAADASPLLLSLGGVSGRTYGAYISDSPEDLP